MTPEEAQRLAEEKWEGLVAGKGERGALCGWCLFANCDCGHCPVYRTVGLCGELEVMRCHFGDPTPENAQAVLDYLREHAQEFIEAAG